MQDRLTPKKFSTPWEDKTDHIDVVEVRLRGYSLPSMSEGFDWWHLSNNYAPTERVGLAEEFKGKNAPATAREACLTLLSNRVGRMMSTTCVPVMPIDRETWRPRIRIKPLNLLGCLWLQFATAIDGNKDYDQCQVCKRWFEVREKPKADHKGQGRVTRRYCTDNDRCRQKAYYLRRKRAEELATNGQSHAEISKTIDSETGVVVDETTIDGWLERAKTRRK